MSERFLTFAPNAGVGPDASLPRSPQDGTVRLTELRNARLEADGRIVPEAGWSSDNDVGYGVVGVAGCPGVGVYVDAAASRSAMLRLQRQTSQETYGSAGDKHTCLVPIRTDTIFYGGTWEQKIAPLQIAASVCGFVVTALNYNALASSIEVLWAVFDRTGMEVGRGTFPRAPATYNACRAYLCGNKVLYVEASSTGGAIYRLYQADEFAADPMTLIGSWTPTVTGGEVYIRIITDVATQRMLFDRLTSNTFLVTGDNTKYFTVTVTPFSVAETNYADGWSTAIRDATGHRSSNRYDRSNGASTPANNTLVFLSGGTTLRCATTPGAGTAYTLNPAVVAADLDWSKRWGVWPIYEPASTHRGAWMPGLWYARFTVAGATWSVKKLNPTWASLPASVYNPTIVYAPQEFPGPYLDMGPDGCIVFGGGMTRAIYLVSPNSATGIHSSNSTIHQVGVHDFAERTEPDTTLPACLWDACLLPQNLLVAVGADHEFTDSDGDPLPSGRVKLMMWRVIRPGDLPTSDADKESIFAHAGRNVAFVTGGLPSTVIPKQYGLTQLPTLLTKPKAPTQSGAGTSGSYVYCCHWVMYSPDGSIVNGPVSKTVTRTRANSYVYRHGLSVDSSANAKLKVFRTTNNGTTFYLVSEVSLADFGTSGMISITTNQVDSAISGNEIIYTQGATGALSGRVETTTTPPCRYYYSGTERHIIGGLGSETSVRVSDVLVTGELPVWPVGGAWYVDVGSRVLGVGEMDGAYLVFAADGVYRFGGVGPDPMGEGTFSTPEKIHAVGVRTDRSVVEADIGFIYQGVDLRFWVVRRGGMTAEPISDNLRSTLAGITDQNNFYPLAECLSATFSWARGLAYFRMNKMASSNTAEANAGKVMVFDTRNGTWFEDQIGANATIGDILWCGADGFRERAAAPHDYADTIWFTATAAGVTDRIKKSRKPGQFLGGTTDWWKGYGDPAGETAGTRPPSFTTANLTEWGKSGWGRIRYVGLALTQDTASVTAGKSYAVTVQATSDGTAYTAVACDGTPKDGVVEFWPEEQKCSVFQLTVTDYSASPLIFHGLQLEQTSSGRGRVR